MREQALLLNDEAMQHFIRHGYITVNAALPRSFHKAICERLDEVIATEGNPGNNILPRVPEIQQVFDHPAVHGALTSVLGPNYAMHPHRYAHCSMPGSKAQTLHKDSTHYSGDEDIRDHCCRWAMGFYYPQDVTEDMGPTSILPGTQYYETRSSDPDNAELLLCGKAGTVTIVHFDVWHRATANLSDKKRYMLKFLFARMEEPRAPSWNAQGPNWLLPEESAAGEKHSLLWQYHWNWLHGKAHQGVREVPVATGHDLAEWVSLLQDPDADRRRRAADALGLMGPQAEGAIPALTAALDDAAETVGLNAAYALGAIGATALPALAEALRKESDCVRHHASIALGVIGRAAVPALIQAAQSEDQRVRAAAVDMLAEVETPSSEVISTLIQALEDEADWVRRHAADTLGNIGPAAGAATLSLANLLKDEKPYVRINAATALGKLGPEAEDAVPALTEALFDSDRYTRGLAALALRRIGTPEAHASLLDFLMTTRWCPITSAKTPY